MSYTLQPRLQNKTDNCYITIHYKDIKQLFDMTIDNACNHLGISKTSLKKICRHFNIQKWPYKRLSKNNIIKPTIPIKKTNKNNIIKPTIPIKKTNKNNIIKPTIPIKKTNQTKDSDMYNDLSFLTGFNINENPYELEKILFYFY